MNAIGKILVVFITASSLGFLAFAAAFRNGGPDWQGETRSPELQRDFVFTVEPSDVPKYSAIHRRTEKAISDKKLILAEVVLDARKTLEQDLNNKQNSLNAEMARHQEAIKGITDTIAADAAGVQTRMNNLNDRVARVQQELEKIGDQYSKLTVETQDVLKVVQERREEGHRLTNQLALLRNDQYAAEDQQKKLDDELVRLSLDRQRLRNRNDQLKKQVDQGK